jgi:hypothetical protein
VKAMQKELKKNRMKNDWPPRVSRLTLAGGFYVLTSSYGPATI